MTGLDRSKIWTGSLNERALEPQPRQTIGLYDTTLRDGEQSVGVVLMPEEKLEIARALDAAGIDRIEAGFPRVSDDDWRAVELIAAAGLRAEVWGFSRAVQADVEALVELGVAASVIESPISDAKLEALGVSRETMLERIAKAVSFATANGIRVAFFGVDSSRADLDFYRRAYAAAVEAGAQEVVVVDTIGIATRIPGRRDGRSPRPRDPRPLARARRLRARDRGGDRRRPGGRDVGPGHGQRDGGAGGQRRLDRGRARAGGAVRDTHPTRPDARQCAGSARAGTRRYAARALEGGHGRQPLRPRVGGRRRAVLLRGRASRHLQSSSARAAASSSGRRAGSTRSASRPPSSASTSPTSSAPACSPT